MLGVGAAACAACCAGPLLAFLGDGSTLRSGAYKENIRNGVKWLRDQQQENGLFGTGRDVETIAVPLVLIGPPLRLGGAGKHEHHACRQ